MTRPEFPDVIDSSMRSDFVSCPRKCELKNILHWKPKDQSIHLHAGGAYAHGLEVARRAFYAEGRPEKEAIGLGLVALMEKYGDFPCPPESAKSCERMLGALEHYFHVFPMGADYAKPHQFGPDILGVEFSFVEPIDVLHPATGQPLLYAGRLDAIMDFAGGVYPLDDKTTSGIGPKWSQQWDLRSQFTAYCLHPQTEVLTRVGWWRIDQLPPGWEIVQWDTNGNLSWTVPTEIHSQDFDGDLITCQGKVAFTCTPEHRLAVFDTYSHEWKPYTAETLPKRSGALRFVSAGAMQEGAEINPAFIRLLVAIQADGSWRNGGVRFHFTKQRKIERLNWILSGLDIEVDTSKSEIYISAKEEWIQTALQFLGQDKLFGDWLLQLGPESLTAFIEELQYWDGSTVKANGWMYFSASKINADWVRTVASLTGHYSSMHTQRHDSEKWRTAYRVCISTDCQHSPHLHTWGKTPYKGKVWCVSVPTSYFLIRDKERISVTGNCWGVQKAGIDTQGFMVRGLAILKTKYDHAEAITYRPAWMVERWYNQMLRDVKRMIACWEEGYWDWNLDESCNAYRGCEFKRICMTDRPEQWLETGYERRKWDPVTRTETKLSND